MATAARPTNPMLLQPIRIYVRVFVKFFTRDIDAGNDASAGARMQGSEWRFAPARSASLRLALYLGRSLGDAFQTSHYLYRCGAEEGDLPSVRLGAMGQGTYGAHDVLRIPRLEEVDRHERS